MAGSDAMSSSSGIRAIQSGCVIPAHPLALTSARKLDERHQRALTRYYVAAGAGGVPRGESRRPASCSLNGPVIGLDRVSDRTRHL